MSGHTPLCERYYMRRAIVILMLLILPLPVLAVEEPIWVETDGESFQSEYDPPKEVMERARRDAERKAIEEALGSFIRAHTLVSNGQLSEDLTYASVRGKVEKILIIKEGWNGEHSVYNVRLKALVRPVYPERGEGITLKLFLSRSLLKEGEEVKVSYESSGDGYIYLFSVAADGSVTLLLPNRLQPDNQVTARKVYLFPPDGSPVKLRAMFLPGFQGNSAQEKIKAIVTRSREEILSVGYQEGIFKVYDAKSTGMLSDLVKRLNQLEPADWTEATAVYQLER